MSQPDTKSLRTIMEGLDEADRISIMEWLHAAAASGQSKMNEARDPQSKQAIFQAAIGLLEADRAKLDALLGAFKELYSGAAPSSSPAIVPNGSDAPGDAMSVAEPPPQAGSADADAPTEVATSDAQSPTQTAPGVVMATRVPYYFCDTCELWVKPTVSHTCTEDGLAEGCYNGFDGQELDIIHTPDGWKEIDPPEIMSEGVAVQNTHAEVVETGVTKQDDEVEPLENSLRPHSKLERVYKMVKELIEASGPQHIDDLLEPALKRQLFLGVQNARANLANFLSKLKRKGLLSSDNRGYWSLPEQGTRTMSFGLAP